MPVTLSVEKSTAVRLLAVGLSPEVIVERVAHPHDVLADAAVLMSERLLLPPSEAAFVDGFAVFLTMAMLTRDRGLRPGAAYAAALDDPRSRPSAADLAAMKELSQRLTNAFLANDRDSADFPKTRSDERHGVALRYVEAFLRQEEVIEALGTIGAQNAPLHAALTDSERQRVDEFLLYRSIRGRFHALDSLVGEWRTLVTALETHPDFIDRDEYVNWLIARDHLADALSLLRDAVEPHNVVRGLDERFCVATRPLARSVHRRSPWQRQGWWWFRERPGTD